MLAGLVAAIGALCYAEVGTLVNESGGEYPILYKGYKGGKWPAFMFAWTCSTILKPSSFAILSLTCAKYTVRYVTDVLPASDNNDNIQLNNIDPGIQLGS